MLTCADAKSQWLPLPGAPPQRAIGEYLEGGVAARSSYAGSKVTSYIVSHSFPVR